MNNQCEVLKRKDAIILDLEDLNQPEKVIKESLTKQGFIIVENHNIDDHLLDKAYELSKIFFDLDIQIKSQYHFSKIDQKKYSDVGYFPLKTEKALGAELPDLKEMFHVAQDYSGNNELEKLFAQNKFPVELTDFDIIFERLFEEFQKLGDILIKLVWRSYYSSTEYIDDLVNNGNSLLRLLHYPPIKNETLNMRAAPHTGIQLLGLQPRTSHEGLQFFTPSRGWITPSTNFKDCIFVNIGDMMEFLLDNEIKATLHKVVNSENDSNLYDRYAIVHFYHSNPLKYLHKRGIVNNKEFVNSGDWLIKRLIEIGVIVH